MRYSLTRRNVISSLAAVGVASLLGGLPIVAHAADKPGSKVPAAPTDLKAHWIGTDANGRSAGVVLTWNAVAGAIRYNVYGGSVVVPQPTAPTFLLAPNIQITAFVDGSARMGIDTIPVYQVTAVNAAGESAKSKAAEPDAPLAATPVVIQGTVTQSSGKSALVKTSVAGSETTYEVDLANALFETADGTPTASEKLTAGETVVIAGLKDPSLGSGTTHPLIHALVVELVVAKAK